MQPVTVNVTFVPSLTFPSSQPHPFIQPNGSMEVNDAAGSKILIIGEYATGLESLLNTT